MLTESFLSFDLESAFVSAVILVVSPIIDPSLVSDHLIWLEKSYGILDDMVSRGNQIANFRKSELQQLEDMLSRLPAHSVRSPALDNGRGSQQQNIQQQSSTGADGHIGSDMQTGTMMNQDVFVDTSTIAQVATLPDVLSTAQLMALAESIEAVEAEWISNAALDNHNW